ncbi:hypothetical protein ACP70R_019389 [Stipagrostis hirtigluma subsp. patula]
MAAQAVPAAAADGALTKYGFPRGYRFVPKNLELLSLLGERLRGRRLPPPLSDIFHDLRILEHHPQDLYEAYKEHEEHGCIYFFSQREFPGTKSADGGGKKANQRPVRACRGGGWKPSGGGKPIKAGSKKNAPVVGKMVTMVFYEKPHDDGGDKKAPVKTNWGLHEFTVRSPGDKYSELAVYRLYKLKNKETKEEEARQVQDHANGVDHCVATVSGDHQPSTSTVMVPPAQQAAGTLVPKQELVVASTAQTQQQLSATQVQQYYQHQYPYAFGAAAAAMPGPSCWAPPAAVNPQAHQAPAAPPMHGAWHASSSLSLASSSAAATSPPPPEQHAVAAAAPPHVQFPSWDAPMEQVVPSPLEVTPPQPELEPAAVEEEMADEGNHGWTDMLGLTMDAGFGDLGDFLLDTPFDDVFTIEELTGTPPTTPPPLPPHEDNPSGRDEYKQGAAAGKQQEPPAILV